MAGASQMSGFRIAITGTPATGKSSVVEIIAKSNSTTVRELAAEHGCLGRAEKAGEAVEVDVEKLHRILTAEWAEESPSRGGEKSPSEGGEKPLWVTENRLRTSTSTGIFHITSQSMQSSSCAVVLRCSQSVCAGAAGHALKSPIMPSGKCSVGRGWN